MTKQCQARYLVGIWDVASAGRLADVVIGLQHGWAIGTNNDGRGLGRYGLYRPSSRRRPNTGAVVSASITPRQSNWRLVPSSTSLGPRHAHARGCRGKLMISGWTAPAPGTYTAKVIDESGDGSEERPAELDLSRSRDLAVDAGRRGKRTRGELDCASLFPLDFRAGRRASTLRSGELGFSAGGRGGWISPLRAPEIRRSGFGARKIPWLAHPP